MHELVAVGLTVMEGRKYRALFQIRIYAKLRGDLTALIFNKRVAAFGKLAFACNVGAHLDERTFCARAVL